jgi:hypothetical protein
VLVPTFSKAAEMWAHGLFVLMLSSNAYQLCFLLFMVDQGTWATIGLKDFVMAGNL